MRSCFELSNGVQMPKIGFGTYKSTDGNDERVIGQALETGYRLLDTAAAYKNEIVTMKQEGDCGRAGNVQCAIQNALSMLCSKLK